jgi:hypothetical protein
VPNSAPSSTPNNSQSDRHFLLVRCPVVKRVIKDVITLSLAVKHEAGRLDFAIAANFFSSLKSATTAEKIPRRGTFDLSLFEHPFQTDKIGKDLNPHLSLSRTEILAFSQSEKVASPDSTSSRFLQEHPQCPDNIRAELPRSSFAARLPTYPSHRHSRSANHWLAVTDLRVGRFVHS